MVLHVMAAICQGSRFLSFAFGERVVCFLLFFVLSEPFCYRRLFDVWMRTAESGKRMSIPSILLTNVTVCALK